VNDNCVDSVVVNAAVLLTYSLITSFIFEPSYIGATAGIWVAIFEATLIIMLKFISDKYQVRFKV
jgi:hypothetical protein